MKRLLSLFKSKPNQGAWNYASRLAEEWRREGTYYVTAPDPTVLWARNSRAKR